MGSLGAAKSFPTTLGCMTIPHSSHDRAQGNDLRIRCLYHHFPIEIAFWGNYPILNQILKKKGAKIMIQDDQGAGGSFLVVSDGVR